MANSFKITTGEVSISFDDEELVLRPTMRAASTISRQFDGFANARAALVRENLDAVVFILRQGLNLSDRDARDLPDRVFKNGITAELLIPLIRYVAVLGNGGRPIDEEEEETTSQTSQTGKNQAGSGVAKIPNE